MTESATEGIVAAVSLVLMPRVFAHAHLAALETFMNLTYSVTVLAVAHWWGMRLNYDSAELLPVPQRERRGEGVGTRQACTTTLPNPLPEGKRGPSNCVTVLTGVLFGLALLSKMQAILIPPIIGLWALWHWRMRAIAPLAIFGLVGFVLFFVGWPWLWLDPVAYLREYFARTTGRADLNCYYLGKVWADKDVPWHYPFVMFAVTVPIGLHLLGVLGLFGSKTALTQTRSAGEATSTEVPRWRFGFVLAPREQLILAATLFPLVLFALPGVTVYDGERLFLVSYPMWAVLIGRGAAVSWDWLARSAESHQWRRTARPGVHLAVAIAALASQAFGVVGMHPCQLSYYNLLVGGLWGADRLGFERTYWGDSVTRSLLTSMGSLEDGRTLAVMPMLHQFQLDELRQQSPIVRSKRIQLVPANGQHDKDSADGWLYFCRKADVMPDVLHIRNGVGLVRQDVRLAAIGWDF